METNKVVARFKNNQILKGKTSNFFPNKTNFHLETQSGELVEISLEQLKALFFVKDFEGDKKREDSYTEPVKGGGRKVRVEFFDGETIIGYTLAYAPDRQGFYMTPADLAGNNDRIFVVRSATEKIELLK